MENTTESTLWAEKTLLTHGYSITGAPERIQETAWSHVLRIATTSGYVFLKITPPELALEANVINILSEYMQHASIPMVIDFNQKLHCFLMQGCGGQARDQQIGTFISEIICAAINEYTRIQIASIPLIKNFLQIGIPDWRLEKLPMLYLQLIQQKDFLLRDGMTNAELQILHALHAKFTDMCASLAAYNIPATLDHCDFHENNILYDQATKKLTIIDWGETVITLPFLSLINCLNEAERRYLLQKTNQEYLAMQDACLTNWHTFATKPKLLEAFKLAEKLWPIYAALAFYRLISGLDCAMLTAKPRNLGTISGHLRAFIFPLKKE